MSLLDFHWKNSKFNQKIKASLERTRKCIICTISMKSESMTHSSPSVLMEKMKNRKFEWLSKCCCVSWGCWWLILEMIVDMFCLEAPSLVIALDCTCCVCERLLSTFEKLKNHEIWRKFWLFVWISDQSERVLEIHDWNFSIECRYLYWIDSNQLTNWRFVCKVDFKKDVNLSRSLYDFLKHSLVF